jgi:hypothetical protein
MPLTDSGAGLVAALIVGTGTPLDNGHGYIGVGDSTAAFAASQTDLQASTNKLRKSMDATFPTVAGNLLMFQATFSPAEANFTWTEWGTFNHPTAGTMLSRIVDVTMGTKLPVQTWVFSVTVSVNI